MQPSWRAEAEAAVVQGNISHVVLYTNVQTDDRRPTVKSIIKQWHLTGGGPGMQLHRDVKMLIG